MQIQKFFPIDDRLAAAAEAAEKSCAGSITISSTAFALENTMGATLPLME